MTALGWAELLGVTALVATTGCLGGDGVGPTAGAALGQNSAAVTAQETERERGADWSVSGNFAPAAGLVEFSSTAPLTATLVSKVSRGVEFFVEGRGLDRRVAITKVASGTLVAGVPYTVSVTPSDIPVQSVGGVVQVKVKARYVDDGGNVVMAQVGPQSMFVTHASGYGRAWASSDNMVALGIAAQTLRSLGTVAPADVLGKAAAMLNDPATDPALAYALLTLGERETGRFLASTTGVWTDFATAQSNLKYTGGGAFRWDARVYRKFRLVATPPAKTWDPLPNPVNVTLCGAMRVDFRDNGPETYLKADDIPLPNTTAIAYGENDTQVKYTGQLDNVGCTTIQITDSVPCIGLAISSTLTGSGNTAFHIGPVTTYHTGVCFKNGVLGGPDLSHTISVGPGVDEPVSRVMAVAARISSMPDPGFVIASGVHNIEAEAGCPSFQILDGAGHPVPGKFGEACYIGALDTAYFGPAAHPVTQQQLNFHTTVDKFVVGHELGHMQQNWSTGSTAVAYPEDSIDAGAAAARPEGCRCDSVVTANRSHCLNSREYLSTAHAEGWAHFYSSKIMNDTTTASCSFTYYKELWGDAVVSGHHVVNVPPTQTQVSCLTPKKWRNNHCGAVETGVEWDWLTFLTSLNTQGVNKLSLAEISDVWQRACGASGTRCADQELSWTATSLTRPPRTVPGAPVDTAAKTKFGVTSPKYRYWQSTGDLNGVSNNLAP